MIRAVAAGVVASRSVESLDYRYRPGEFMPELHVCPAADRGWAVDLESLREAFDKTDGCGWYAAPAEPGKIPYFWVEGEFGGHEVFLRLLPVAEAGQGSRTWRRSKG